MTLHNTTSAITSPTHVVGLFAQRVAATPAKEAFRILEQDQWRSVSWQETAARVDDLAAGLLALGIQAQQRVAIVSGTRYEWIIADLAIMASGAVTTTVYPSAHPAETAHIVSNSQSGVVFAEDARQLAKLVKHLGELPQVAHIVLFDGHGDGDWILSLDDLAHRGSDYLRAHPRCLHHVAEATRADWLCQR